MKKKKISKASKAFYIALSYLSPRLNTKLLFLKKFGRFPDLKDPKTLNEKILKLKLETYGRDPLGRQADRSLCHTGRDRMGQTSGAVCHEMELWMWI